MRFDVLAVAFILRLSISLAALLLVVIALGALRVIPPEQKWLLKFSFALASATLLSFTTVFLGALHHYGGFGMSPSGFIAISFLSLETGVLGFLAFASPFRFFSLTFSLIGIVTIAYFLLRRV